jgi:transposase
VAGALQAGFATELWTVKRVRSVIEREFGVKCSQTGCCELDHWHRLPGSFETSALR